MLAVTDLVVIVFLIILASNGAYQGFLRSLVGPMALILSLITSVIVYFGTRHFNAAFLTVVLGPFFYGWIIVSLMKKWLNPEEAPRLSVVSRAGGQVVNLLWGTTVVIIVVSFLAFFPFKSFDLPGISKDVRRSLTFRLVQPIFLNSALITGEPDKPYGCTTDLCSIGPEDLQSLAADPSIQAIMNDPRIQKMMNDPATQKAIESKDVNAILASPVVRELSQDPKFLVQAFKAFPKIQKLRAATGEKTAQDPSR